MYIPGKNRYKDYTSRYDVYLFTLRDFTEMIIDMYGGSYIERSDMPIHSGYLMKFSDAERAIEYIASIAISSSTSGNVTTYVLPHTDGNTLPVYATSITGIDVVYIGLSAFPEALDLYANNAVFVTLSYGANSGSGTMTGQTTTEGKTVKLKANGFTAPSSKVFKEWNTKTDGTGTSYDPGDSVEVTADITIYAIWDDE